MAGKSVTMCRDDFFFRFSSSKLDTKFFNFYWNFIRKYDHRVPVFGSSVTEFSLIDAGQLWHYWSHWNLKLAKRVKRKREN